MENKEYQQFTNTTNKYPKDKQIECLAMELCSEAGEVAGKIKKIFRDNTKLTPELCDAIADEVGDCFWSASELCTKLGYTISEVMAMNVIKLESRMQRGKIGGSGDNR